jgi:hypothetical protein
MFFEVVVFSLSDWSGMGRFYKGEVVEYDAKKKKHKV